MRYSLLALAFLLPASALAASPSIFTAERNLAVASSSYANAYYAAGALTVSGATAGDLSALAGSMTIAAPVAGDALLAGGVVTLRAPVAGDVRAFGGRVALDAPMSGDEVVVGGSVEDSGGGAKNVFIIGANVTLAKGTNGPVVIYANNVALAGNFTGDVRVVAAGRVSLLAGTTIHGALSYQSPEQASVASSAKVLGGISYTGASYLPTSAQAHALALAAVGVFLFVKILGALILAGLIAGLFPLLAEQVAAEALDRPARRVLLSALLGFAIAVATPVLLILLALTFVGLGLALLLGLAYALLLLLAFVYTGIILGALGARYLWRRETILWHDAVLGMLAVSLITMIPVVGSVLLCLLAAFAVGALSRIFYTWAFSHEIYENA